MTGFRVSRDDCGLVKFPAGKSPRTQIKAEAGLLLFRAMALIAERLENWTNVANKVDYFGIDLSDTEKTQRENGEQDFH